MIENQLKFEVGLKVTIFQNTKASNGEISIVSWYASSFRFTCRFSRYDSNRHDGWNCPPDIKCSCCV